MKEVVIWFQKLLSFANIIALISVLKNDSLGIKDKPRKNALAKMKYKLTILLVWSFYGLYFALKAIRSNLIFWDEESIKQRVYELVYEK